MMDDDDDDDDIAISPSLNTDLVAYDSENMDYEKLESESVGDLGGLGRRDEEYKIEENVQLPGVDDLPLFASAEARKIDSDIKQKETDIEALSEKASDMVERLKVMKNHFKNVQQELDHTNQLSIAKVAEMKTEKHLQQLTSRAVGQNKSETKRLTMELEKVKEELSQVQGLIHKSNEKMDEFKMKMNWNQDELERWAVASKQKEDDSIVLQKYTRADEAKIKELNFSIEQLTREKLKCEGYYEQEKLETLSKQMELDRIAEEFKKLHGERQDLVSRWQDAINEIKNRDSEINDLGGRFAAAKTERAKKEMKVGVQLKRLDRQQLENKEVETRVENLSRTVSRKREEMITGSLKLQVFRDELESHKNELTIAADSLITRRSENAHKSQANEEKRVKLDRERAKYKQVKLNLQNSKDTTVKAEEVARMSEVELQRREQDLEVQSKSLKIFKERLLKETQAVADTKKEKVRFENEIQGARSISKNLESQISALDKEASRQQELLYNAEFQIQQTERKVARGLGERSDEEKKLLKNQIIESESNLEKLKEKKKMLVAQSRKLQNELALRKGVRDEAVSLKTKLIEKQAELELSSKMIEEEIRRETKIKEESSVQNDLMGLEVRRLKEQLSVKADVVWSLENRKQQLMLSMEERTGEISVHRDVLKAELKALNEEKHRITMELRTGEAAVDKLKARFEVQARGDGEGKPQSFYIIQAAQRREELQRRGDELDQTVRKCEREIRTLQTTLDHLNARNCAYRNSFQKVDLKGDDVEVLKQLEDRTKVAKENIFRQKKELNRLNTDLEEDTRRVEAIKLQNIKNNDLKEHLKAAHAQVNEEMLSQSTELDELNEKADRLTLRHRQKVCEASGYDYSDPKNAAIVTLEEKVAQTEVLKDVVQNVLYTLGRLAVEFPEVSDLLSQSLRQADLKMPPRPPYQSNTRSRNGSMNHTKSSARSHGGRPNSQGGNNIHTHTNTNTHADSMNRSISSSSSVSITSASASSASLSGVIPGKGGLQSGAVARSTVLRPSTFNMGL